MSAVSSTVEANISLALSQLNSFSPYLTNNYETIHSLMQGDIYVSLFVALWVSKNDKHKSLLEGNYIENMGKSGLDHKCLTSPKNSGTKYISMYSINGVLQMKNVQYLGEYERHVSSIQIKDGNNYRTIQLRDGDDYYTFENYETVYNLSCVYPVSGDANMEYVIRTIENC